MSLTIAAGAQPNAGPIIKAKELPVKDRSGEILFYVTAASARRMLAKDKVTPLGSKKLIRGLQIARDFDTSKVTPITAYVGTRYSHARETNTNPRNVWTLHRIADKDWSIHRRVLLDCLSKAA